MTGAELVVFDCDGVLVDSERISVRVGREILAELGWSLTEAEFVRRFVGCSAEHFRAEVAGGLGYPMGPDWEVRHQPRYRAAFEADLLAVPGVADVLDALDADGTPYCVASNSDHEHVATVLSLTGLDRRFQGRAFSAQDVARGKPAPDLFLHAARSMGTEPGRTVVVEDSVFGVRAALAASMTCLAYAGGLTSAAELAAEGPVVFASMADLPSLLTRLLCAGPGPDEVCA